MWVKIDAHPCWRVQKALDEQGIEYEVVKGPLRPGKRDDLKRLWASSSTRRSSSRTAGSIATNQPIWRNAYAPVSCSTVPEASRRN